jgi:hypothetical protein
MKTKQGHAFNINFSKAACTVQCLEQMAKVKTKSKMASELLRISSLKNRLKVTSGVIVRSHGSPV